MDEMQQREPVGWAACESCVQVPLGRGAVPSQKGCRPAVLPLRGRGLQWRGGWAHRASWATWAPSDAPEPRLTRPVARRSRR